VSPEVYAVLAAMDEAELGRVLPLLKLALGEALTTWQDETPLTLRTIALRYAHGQRVHLPEAQGMGTVVQQRVTWRDVLGPVVEYLVHCEGTGALVGWHAWYAEPDLEPVPETGDDA